MRNQDFVAVFFTLLITCLVVGATVASVEGVVALVAAIAEE